MKVLLLLACLGVAAFALPIEREYPWTNKSSVDLDRARMLAHYSSVAYCSEGKILSWNCQQCFEPGLVNFTPVKFIRGYLDAQGYFGFDDSQRTIFVIFQGSASIQNWIANLQFYKLDYDYPGVSGARVHSGFYESSKTIFEDLQPDLEKLLGSKPGYKIVVTGHSQGGALANMVSLMIADTYRLIPEVQTFGEPRVGNFEYAAYWKSRIQTTNWRFTHMRDPVPQLPPTWLGFHHRVTEVFLKNGAGTDHIVCDDSGEDPDCHNSVWLPIDVFDHLWYLDIYLGIPCL